MRSPWRNVNCVLNVLESEGGYQQSRRLPSPQRAFFWPLLSLVERRKQVGHLIYNGTDSYEFDERTLAHLKTAITMKLRMRESFLLNWVVPSESGSGRRSLWLSPDVPLAFQFRDDHSQQLNRAWLDALSRSAQGIRGMTVMSEEEAAAYLKAAGGSNAP